MGLGARRGCYRLCGGLITGVSRRPVSGLAAPSAATTSAAATSATAAAAAASRSSAAAGCAAASASSGAAAGGESRSEPCRTELPLFPVTLAPAVRTFVDQCCRTDHHPDGRKDGQHRHQCVHRLAPSAAASATATAATSAAAAAPPQPALQPTPPPMAPAPPPVACGSPTPSIPDAPVMPMVPAVHAAPAPYRRAHIARRSTTFFVPHDPPAAAFRVVAPGSVSVCFTR